MARASNAVPSTEDRPTKKRLRKNQDGKKPGKVSWIHGTKEVFFRKREGDWKAAQEAGTGRVTRFYDEITKLYVQKYGYKMADKDDLEEDVEDPTDPNKRDADADDLDDVEAARRSKLCDRIRGRIGQWYRQQYGGNVDKGAQSALADMLLSGLDVGSGKPSKAQGWQFYSKLHYEECVKGRFAPAWETEVQRCKDLDLEPPHEVAVRSAVTREAWEGESEEFRAAVLLQMEEEYKQKVRAWEIVRLEDTLKSREELSMRVAALNGAASTLQPLVDAIASKFQLNASIFLCGPIGDRGGTIQVRSVHAGRTLGLSPKKWYDADRIGYREAEKSMILFTERCFSVEECMRRALPATTTGGGAGAEALRTGPAPAGAAGGAPVATAAAGLEGRGSPAREYPDPPPSSARPRSSSSARISSPAPAQLSSPASSARLCYSSSSSPTSAAGLCYSSSTSSAAHAAFAMGIKWGKEWSDLVAKYLEFEKVCGYQEEGGGRIGGENRPEEVGRWISRARQWFSPPVIGNLGKLREKGSYVDRWWLWWKSVQPSERVEIEQTGMLTLPMKMSWGKLPKLYGNNGFMQVMASLLWWGLTMRGEEEKEGWLLAVADVECILHGVIESGEAKPPAGKKDAAPATQKRKRADVEGEGSRKKLRSSDAGSARGRTTRATGKTVPRTTVVRPKPKPAWGKKKKSA
ncbi:hypothetical protein C8R46DRAFT_1238480 [Mycena filopes]|nr:hypothetical protein C8R46DRAFT_1238480 [Mycena filopes]